MAGEVTFTPTEEDIVAGSKDWFRRMLMQPRIKGAFYVAILAGGLLGAAFALQAGGPPERALRAAALGALIGLLLFGGILAARRAMLPGQALRAFRQNKTIHHPYTYAWTDEGISFESETANARIAWRDLYRWGEGRSAFLFAVSERGVHFVPRRALSEAEAADLRATAISHGPARL
jgi:YcxB-like protein